MQCNPWGGKVERINGAFIVNDTVASEDREKVSKWFDEVLQLRCNEDGIKISIISVPHREDNCGSKA